MNVLTGPNAQGKTNLLEALGFLLTGRSFRTTRLAEIPRWGVESTSLHGEVCRDNGTRLVRRNLACVEDGVWRATGESCPWARAIAFRWQDPGIVKGSPAARGNFVDGFAGRLYPGHLSPLVRFRQLLARRNRLLQTRAAGPSGEHLEPWDEQLAPVAMALLERRRLAV